MSNKNILKICSWVLGMVVLALAGSVWAMERVDGGALSAYDIFPVLGLSAFSIMWTHYVLGSLRRLLKVDATVNKTYFEVTGVVVLFLILLHPGILIAQLYRDGYGLPPNSYVSVYGQNGLKLALGFGTIALVIFLLFELKRKFKNKSWWKYIEYAQLLAMGLIFYHGLTLGRELSIPWYKAVWFFYGLSFIGAVIYNRWYDRNTKRR